MSGLLFSLCAALEVVVMSVFVIRPVDGTNRGLLLIGFRAVRGLFRHGGAVADAGVALSGPDPRAIAIGILSVVGMAYIQTLLPGRAGVASALFGNTMSAGFLLSGLGTGLWAEALGYWSIFTVCIVLCLIGGAVLYWPRGRVEPISLTIGRTSVSAVMRRKRAASAGSSWRSRAQTCSDGTWMPRAPASSAGTTSARIELPIIIARAAPSPWREKTRL